MRSERVGGIPSPPRRRYVVRFVDDAEVEPELLAHLRLPCDLEGRGTDDQHPSRPMADGQLLDHEPGLDRLAEPDVVGDEKVHARHLDRADNWIELVVLDCDTAAERRLERPDVGSRAGTPPYGGEEYVKAVGRVESCRVGQRNALVHACAGLDFPDDLKFLAEAVVLDGGEGDEVLVTVGSVGFERRGRQGTGTDVGDDPAPLADLGELAQLGHGDSGNHCLSLIALSCCA